MQDLIKSGLLYKRRNGLGKHMPTAWVYRYFTLTKAGVLSYYETPYDPNSVGVEDLRPRGRVDLLAVNYELHREPSIEGAPTSYAFVLHFTDEKWKLCADMETDHSRWCLELQNFQNRGNGNGSSADSHHVQRGGGHYTSQTGIDLQTQPSLYSSPMHTPMNRDRDNNNVSARCNEPEPGSSGGGSTKRRKSKNKRSKTGGADKDADKDKDQRAPGMALVQAGGTGNSDESGNSNSSSTGGAAPRGSSSTERRAAAGKSAPKNVPAARPGGKKVVLNRSAAAGSGSLLDMESFCAVAIANQCTYFAYMYLIGGYGTADTTFSAEGNTEWSALIAGVVGHSLVGQAVANAVAGVLPALPASGVLVAFAYIFIGNMVLLTTLYLRSNRASAALAAKTESAAALAGSSLQLQAANEATAAAQAAVAAAKGGDAGAFAAVDADVCADSKSEEEVREEDEHPMVDGKPVPGYTMAEVTGPQRQTPTHTWSACDHEDFHVRIGPNYSWNKKKAPSPPPLYEVFATDIFSSAARVDHASTRFAIPEEYTNVNTRNKFVPPVFVVQIQIPAEEPSIWNSVTDGPGWSICMFFRITESTLKQLENLETASPAVKLWAQWCEKAPEDKTWRARFKFISSCSNLVELGVPSSIANYNAKPILIRRTGSLYRGEGNKYMEFDMHIHTFDTMAKKGIFYMTSLCAEMFCQIGYVIEGRADEELPEALFGCAALNRPQETLSNCIFD